MVSVLRLFRKRMVSVLRIMRNSLKRFISSGERFVSLRKAYMVSVLRLFPEQLKRAVTHFARSAPSLILLNRSAPSLILLKRAVTHFAQSASVLPVEMYNTSSFIDRKLNYRARTPLSLFPNLWISSPHWPVPPFQINYWGIRLNSKEFTEILKPPYNGNIHPSFSPFFAHKTQNPGEKIKNAYYSNRNSQ